jgi:hypothetical protein
MKKLILVALFLSIASFFTLAPALAQNGTLHGVNVTFSAPSPVGGSGVIAGYNIYQCLGTCTITSTWVKVDSTLDLTTAYLVPLSGLTLGATYSYAATTVDSNGNESVFSNIATVTLPATAPTNPNAPSGTLAKVQ